MSKKYNLIQVHDIIEDEGLGYAVQHYMSGDSIADETLAKMWDEAARALDKIEAYLANEDES